MISKQKAQLSLAQYIFLRARPAGVGTVPLVQYAKACIKAANDARAAKAKSPEVFYWSGRTIRYAMTRRNVLLGLSFAPGDEFYRWDGVAQ